MHSRSSDPLRLNFPLESGKACPLAVNSVCLFLACNCASLSSCDPAATCLSTLAEGPHCSGEVFTSFQLLVKSKGFLFLGDLELEGLSFEGSFASLPSMVEAIPCNDVHDDSHKPVAVMDGFACDPPNPKPLSDLLLHGATSGVRAFEVDLEG